MLLHQQLHIHMFSLCLSLLIFPCLLSHTSDSIFPVSWSQGRPEGLCPSQTAKPHCRAMWWWMRSYQEGNTGREAKKTVEQISQSDVEKVGRRAHCKCFKMLIIWVWFNQSVVLNYMSLDGGTTWPTSKVGRWKITIKDMKDVFSIKLLRLLSGYQRELIISF